MFGFEGLKWPEGVQGKAKSEGLVLYVHTYTLMCVYMKTCLSKALDWATSLADIVEEYYHRPCFEFLNDFQIDRNVFGRSCLSGLGSCILREPINAHHIIT